MVGVETWYMISLSSEEMMVFKTPSLEKLRRIISSAIGGSELPEDEGVRCMVKGLHDSGQQGAGLLSRRWGCGATVVQEIVLTGVIAEPFFAPCNVRPTRTPAKWNRNYHRRVNSSNKYMTLLMISLEKLGLEGKVHQGTSGGPS